MNLVEAQETIKPVTPNNLVDFQNFFAQFQDFLAPKLDTYEQAIYLYIFRQSRFIGLDETTIAFKSERKRLALGIGEKDKPMSENSVYKRLSSLETKGCLKIRTTHSGRSFKLYLPHEIPGILPSETLEEKVDMEQADFFTVPENRLLLLERENYKCFYTLQKLDSSNFVVEHVVSRPLGNNTYRNCVAASREANNKKGSASAEDFFRRLFREGFLNEDDFQDRLNHLTMLKSGDLKPILKNQS